MKDSKSITDLINVRTHFLLSYAIHTITFTLVEFACLATKPTLAWLSWVVSLIVTASFSIGKLFHDRKTFNVWDLKGMLFDVFGCITGASFCFAYYIALGTYGLCF